MHCGEKGQGLACDNVRWSSTRVVGHLPGFKDLHLPNVCVPSVLVVRQDADLKMKGFHWSEQMGNIFSITSAELLTFFSHIPSLFVISMSTHSSGSSKSKTLICFIYCITIVHLLYNNCIKFAKMIILLMLT